MNSTSERMAAELLIARAFGRLSSLPDQGSEATVSLASLGNCEVRMFRSWQAHLESMPLFWLELFDHGARMSVDSFLCHKLKDAAPIVNDFMSQAALLSGPS